MMMVVMTIAVGGGYNGGGGESNGVGCVGNGNDGGCDEVAVM